MVSRFQWKLVWLATQRDPQNDWAATQNRVNYDVFTRAPLRGFPENWSSIGPEIDLLKSYKILEKRTVKRSTTAARYHRNAPQTF